MITFAGQPWAPSAYTPPLRGVLADSDGPRLAELLEAHWRLPSGELVVLDEWQHALLNHILERYPADWPIAGLRGRLRFRQAVACMGRQNGKSLFGGGLATYGLTQHVPDPSVIGIATSVEQANVVYDRVKYAVDNDPLLTQLLRASGTRGIRWRDGRGGYTVKPSKREGLQSVPVTLGIADELHLMLREMWYSVVNGQRSREDALIVGITTAGDEASHLLKELYVRGYDAIADPTTDERFGFWLWQAPEGSTITTPGAIEAANPAVACGRISLDTVIADVARSPVPDQERYTLNRFIDASRSWADLTVWDNLPGTTALEPAVIGIDRSSGWEWVSIVAAAKTADGTIVTDTVCSLRGIGRDDLLELLDRLEDAYPGVAYALDARRLSDVGKRLRDLGREVWMLTQTELAQASAGVYARVMTGGLAHDHRRIIRRQLATSHQKRLSDGSWAITAGPAPADAIIATFIAAHVADVRVDTGLQLFV